MSTTSAPEEKGNRVKILINADALTLERELREIDNKIKETAKRGRIGVNELTKLRAQRGITANALMKLLNRAGERPRSRREVRE